MTVPMRRPSASGPMQRADVPEIAALFRRAFRDGTPPSADLRAYFEQSFFGSPLYDPAVGSLVHRAPGGAIDSALLVIPMQIRVGERILTGRLMSNYMTDPLRPTRGGAEMVLTIRARNQDFCFSDSANPVSTAHWKAVGGKVLPINSLDWRLILRPAGWLVERGAARVPGWLRPLLRGVAGLIDRVVPRRPLKTAASAGAPMADATFLALAPHWVARFALAPVWSADELTWLLAMARRNTINGPLHLRQVHGKDGQIVGGNVFYARSGATARVLNILALPGHEAAVIDDLIQHANELGCVAVQGMAQPFAMEALGRHRAMRFVPRGGFCISTRHAEIIDAALRGDLYLGGLAGEDWSRLVTDFHD